MEQHKIYEELLNLSSVEITNIEINSKAIDISCRVKQQDDKCPNCGLKSGIINQYYTRKIRT